MANSTDPFAMSVHGTNPQNLIEKIMRNRIYANLFWKEHCFGLNAEDLIDKAVELKYCGGAYSANSKPAPFLCLLLKMLQIQPELDIVREFVQNEDYKYLRVLGAMYFRLVARSPDVYRLLEPLYNDYRKLRQRTTAGWRLTTVDQFVRELLTAELVCDVALPRLAPRLHLEKQDVLPPYRSALQDMGADIEALAQEAAEALKLQAAEVTAGAGAGAGAGADAVSSAVIVAAGPVGPVAPARPAQEPGAGASSSHSHNDARVPPRGRERGVDNRPAWATRVSSADATAAAGTGRDVAAGGGSNSDQGQPEHGGGGDDDGCTKRPRSHSRSRSRSPGGGGGSSSASSSSEDGAGGEGSEGREERKRRKKEAKKEKKRLKKERKREKKREKKRARRNEDKYSGLFKQPDRGERDGSAADGKPVDDVEHWNAVRAKLGMKPLKQ
eukprot:g4782.t1